MILQLEDRGRGFSVKRAVRKKQEQGNKVLKKVAGKKIYEKSRKAKQQVKRKIYYNRRTGNAYMLSETESELSAAPLIMAGLKLAKKVATSPGVKKAFGKITGAAKTAATEAVQSNLPVQTGGGIDPAIYSAFGSMRSDISTIKNYSGQIADKIKQVMIENHDLNGKVSRLQVENADLKNQRIVYALVGMTGGYIVSKFVR